MGLVPKVVNQRNVIPAQAGIQNTFSFQHLDDAVIPAQAGIQNDVKATPT